MSKVSNDLTTLDFETVKENLKSYLKNQAIFKDYDFEASNINVLLDVLAYNTNLNAFYLNMIANEMFLDTALNRDSIISHAKELNYLPRSFRSAQATVDIYLRDDSDEASLLIPRGTTFTGTVDNKNFTFTTNQNIQALSIEAASEVEPNFLATDVILYEGDYVQDTFIKAGTLDERYILKNKTIDTNSLIVSVIEDNGENILSYSRRDSLFGLGTTSQVFFIQPAENDSYEIVFGDGIIGRAPKDNSLIVVQYRSCNGELPNGIRNFAADDDIGTASVVQITTTRSAENGAVAESLSSIKFNAPRAFSTQERVITASDYATLLKANFSEINDVTAYGGEESNPPQFGKVVVAVDLKQTDSLPPSYIEKYKEFIRPRAPLAIDPIFVTPEYLYLSIDSNVKYDINQTALNIDDITSLVLSAIQEFNSAELNGFNKTLFYSKLVTAIDAAQSSIVSNNTEVRATKFVPITNLQRNNYLIDFSLPIKNNIGVKPGIHSPQLSAITSSTFKYQGLDCFLEDDGDGTINISQETGTSHVTLTNVGTVDYNTGLIRLENIVFESIYGGALRISVIPKENDITSRKRSILRVLDSDIKINVQQVRI